MQAPVEIAVVIPTMGSNLLCRAVTSIFEQNYKQAFQILIGLDQSPNERAASQKMMKRMINQLHAQCPAHITLTIIDPGYSTRVNAGEPRPRHRQGRCAQASPF